MPSSSSLPGPDLEAPLAELVEAADPLDRVVAGPVLHRQLVEPLERRRAITSRAAAPRPPPRRRPPTTPRRRISAGSVSPWPTTVTRISAKVMNRIRSRSGSGRAGVGLERQRQRGGERDRAAHPRPGRHDPLRAAHPPLALRGPPIERPDQVGHREHPGEARADHGGADERGVADHLAGAVAVEPVDDHRQLQPDQDEQGGVEEEDEDLPDRGSPAGRVWGEISSGARQPR